MTDTTVTGKLTPEQIENWRKVLCGLIGPYALMMTDEQIRAYRDQIQGVVGTKGGEE